MNSRTFVLLAMLAAPAAALAEGPAAAAAPIGAQLPLWTVGPFGVLLLCIAVCPLFAAHWWEHNSNKAVVAGLLAVPVAIYMGTTFGHAGQHLLLEAALDYVSFLALLGSLFVISGGIYLKGSLAGTPTSNALMLALGAVLSNFVGTTGSSVIMIRPLLRANAKRKSRAHIVIFFIFVVSNCSGLLTPLGDPPLFLGFLKGVPFAWTASLWKQWVLVNGLLLVTFHFFDSYMLDKEEAALPGNQHEQVMKHEPFGIDGGLNALFLLGVVLVIIGKGQGWGSASGTWPFGIQEGLMLALGVVGYLTTAAKVREANRFSFGPIIEVAVLFAGIFITMVPPLQILNARGSELGLTATWHYFWATGALSSFLDNAPTYLTFAAAACGKMGVSVEGAKYLGDFLAKGPEAVQLLTAISCGAVFMGANTYIGNGPNFMVKAIAEENGVTMPSFFGYMAYSGAILIPIFVVVTMVFFR